MTSTRDPAPELLGLVLSEFQDALSANLQYHWSPTSGKPPRYGRVDLTERMEFAFAKWEPLASWRISQKAVYPGSVGKPPSPKVDGMFYNWFYGWFYFADDLSEVFVNWQTGPLFGRGFRHRIGRDVIGRYLLDRGACTWIS
jgi:hypothetical protein